MLDALLCARFLDRDLTAPPATPADGDTYLIHATATGGWAGQDGHIAYAVDGAWRFYAPFAGLAAYVVDEARLIVFDGSAWVDYTSILSFQNLPLVGVNTTADATNKFAAKSSAVLFDNIGNGVQAKLNKHAAGDTASLLYQTNYSGRAEIGLCGDDDFHFKVSPDGSTWFDGFDINRADGSVDFLASEATIASAATTDLGAAPSLKVSVTGTTAITSFGAAAHALRFVRFAGALTLTHNATSLILLGGASRVTAAGDVGIYTSDAGGNWRERSFVRAASDPGDAATKSGVETLTNKTLGGATLSGTTALPGSGVVSSAGALGLGTASPVGALTVNGSGSFGDGVTSALATRSLNLIGSAAVMRIYRMYTGTGNTSATVELMGTVDGGATNSTWWDTGVAVNAGGLIPQDNFFIRRRTAGGSTPALLIDTSGNILPGVDNGQNCGTAANRFATIYAGTGTINTSGRDTKTDIAPLSAAEIAVARTLAANVRVFRFCDAAARKGADARRHIGMLFEDVVAAFTAQGLDPMRYGIVCRDPATPAIDQTGAPRWTLGLRYDELAQFVIAGLAARLAALETP